MLKKIDINSNIIYNTVHNDRGAVMTIGDKIKYIRQRYGISQKEMGDICGVSMGAVSSWEQGRNDPRPRILSKIAKHFNIPLEALLHPQDGIRFEALIQRRDFSVQEERFLDKYRQLSPLGRETVDAVIDTQLKGQDVKASDVYESCKAYGQKISPEIQQEMERYLHYLLAKESEKNKNEK